MYCAHLFVTLPNEYKNKKNNEETTNDIDPDGADGCDEPRRTGGCRDKEHVAGIGRREGPTAPVCVLRTATGCAGIAASADSPRRSDGRLSRVWHELSRRGRTGYEARRRQHVDGSGLRQLGTGERHGEHHDEGPRVWHSGEAELQSLRGRGHHRDVVGGDQHREAAGDADNICLGYGSHPQGRRMDVELLRFVGQRGTAGGGIRATRR